MADKPIPVFTLPPSTSTSKTPHLAAGKVISLYVDGKLTKDQVTTRLQGLHYKPSDITLLISQGDDRIAKAAAGPKTASYTSTNGATATGSKLSYSQLRALWIQAGGAPELASTMAAVAMAESTGRVNALNDNPSTGDYSVGLWQINYLGDLRASRTAQFGTPELLRSDPLANAKAAVALAGDGSGLGNWPTYTGGAYKAYYHPETPAEKAADTAATTAAKAANPAVAEATTAAATAVATTKANDPAYIQAQADEAEALALAKIQGKVAVQTQTAIAKATVHATDSASWVTVNKDGTFGQAFGAKPPANVLLIGGQPATKADYQQAWTYNYDQVYQSYTGKSATPRQQADILRRGMSIYTLRDELSKRPTFVSAPIYKSTAAGIKAAAKLALGTAPPPDFVRKAIAQDWDADTITANIRALPAYKKGPEFKANVAAVRASYTKIYGTPQKSGGGTVGDGGAAVNGWIQNSALKGWTTDQVEQKLRADPNYKYSPEYQTKALNFLDAMGLFTGSRPIAGVQDPTIIKMNTQGTKLGKPPLNLQVGMGGQ